MDQKNKVWKENILSMEDSVQPKLVLIAEGFQQQAIDELVVLSRTQTSRLQMKVCQSTFLPVFSRAMNLPSAEHSAIATGPLALLW